MTEIQLAPQEGAATAPEKKLFLETLTKDIDLFDAVMDLVDNCLDGAVRLAEAEAEAEAEAKDPRGAYFERKVTIRFNGETFEVEDNCGGIPLNVARTRAFRWGRPAELEEMVEGAVGRFGVGMKRAIYKLGTNAVVTSRSFESTDMRQRANFRVIIPEDWTNSNEWTPYPLEMMAPNADGVIGTHLAISNVHDSAKRRLGIDLQGLRKKLSRHYALIIERGLKIVVVDVEGNQHELDAEHPFQTLVRKDGVLEPFVETGTHHDVRYSMAVGFQKNPVPTSDEPLNPEAPSGAGWSIACNDRIVVWRDTSELTGWGARLPRHHTQFNAIAGLVRLEGEASDMPLTTTKSGLDTTHPVYLHLLERIVRSTRKLTAFTNYAKTDRVSLSKRVQQLDGVKVLELTDGVNTAGATPSVHEPILPITDGDKVSDKVRISFMVDKNDAKEVANFLKLRSNATVMIGERCFAFVLEEARG